MRAREILGQAGIVQVGEEIYELALQVASGRKSKPEALGLQEFFICRYGGMPMEPSKCG